MKNIKYFITGLIRIIFLPLLGVVLLLLLIFDIIMKAGTCKLPSHLQWDFEYVDGLMYWYLGK